MPDLRSLETFFWVAQLRSFKAAAERLRTTQPAVSLRIAGLESELGVKLLDRGARVATPTARGRLLFDYAERFLKLQTEMLDAVAAPEALGGVVRLGVSETIVHTWLARFVERVHALHPQVTLEIEVDVSPALAAGLTERRLDLAFLLGDVTDPTIETRALCRYPLAFVASPALPLARDLAELADIAAWPIITYPKTTRPYIELMRLFNAPGVPRPRVYASSSLSTIVRMALDEIGVSVIPPVVIAAEQAAGRLRIVPVAAPLPDLVYSVAFGLGDTGLNRRLAELACLVAGQDGAQNAAQAGTCDAIRPAYGAQSKDTISANAKRML